jgi:hypothetical protein
LPGTRSRPKRHRGKLSPEERFLQLGKKHFAEDFPNPTRQGCPSETTLKLLAATPSQVEDSVLDHITFCSPCYRTYSRFLQKLKAKGSNRNTRPRARK